MLLMVVISFRRPCSWALSACPRSPSSSAEASLALTVRSPVAEALRAATAAARGPAMERAIAMANTTASTVPTAPQVTSRSCEVLPTALDEKMTATNSTATVPKPRASFALIFKFFNLSPVNLVSFPALGAGPAQLCSHLWSVGSANTA